MYFSSYYNNGEIKDFEGNECEWPIFYTYMIIDGVFKNSTEQIEEYQAELRKCMYADDNGGIYDSSILVCIAFNVIVSFRSGNYNVFCAGRV